MIIFHEKDHGNLPTDAGTGPAIIFYGQVCPPQAGPAKTYCLKKCVLSIKIIKVRSHS